MTHNQFFFFPFRYAVLLYIYDKCTIFLRFQWMYGIEMFNACLVQVHGYDNWHK